MTSAGLVTIPPLDFGRYTGSVREAHELNAALTLMLHHGSCREGEWKAAKALTVRMVALLMVLRNRATM